MHRMPHTDPPPRRGAGELEAAVLSVRWPAGRAPVPGAGPRGRHSGRGRRVWAGGGGAWGGCSTLARGLLGGAAVVRIPLVASLGHWSLGVLGRDTPAGITVALLAGVLLGAAVLAICGFVIRRCRALAGAFREARWLPGRGQAVVVADEAADAYALPGWPGRIVVPAGGRAALAAPGRAALVAQ